MAYKKNRKRNSFSTYGQNNILQKRNLLKPKVKQKNPKKDIQNSFIKSCVFLNKTHGLKDTRIAYLNYLN